MIQAVVKLLLKRASERERELCISSWSREDLKGFRMTPNLPYLYLFTLYLYALFFYLCAISSLRSGFLSLYYIISEIWISISVLYHLWDLVFYCYTISYLRSGFLSLYYISGLFFYLCTISLLGFISLHYIWDLVFNLCTI